MKIEQININEIQKGYNPRKNFDIIDLKESVAKHGILVPLIVRPKGKQFEIISGECRWRVAKELKLKELPCSVKELSDEDSANISYIDNKQRNNLSPIEESKHFAFMRDSYGYSASQLADKYGCSKGLIGQYWGISDLPESFNQLNDLSFRHLYQLSKLVDKNNLIKIFEEGFGIGQETKPYETWTTEEQKQLDKEHDHRLQKQLNLAQEIIDQEYTVKQTEKLVKSILYVFNQRDDAIKLQGKEKANKIISALRDHAVHISRSFIDVKNHLIGFGDHANMVGDDFLKVITEDNKTRFKDELSELYQLLDTFNFSDVKEDIERLLKRMEEI